MFSGLPMDRDQCDKLASVCPGVLLSGNGERSIRLRPSLIFQQRHVDIFADIFDQVLRDNN